MDVLDKQTIARVDQVCMLLCDFFEWVPSFHFSAARWERGSRGDRVRGGGLAGKHNHTCIVANMDYEPRPDQKRNNACATGGRPAQA